MIVTKDKRAHSSNRRRLLCWGTGLLLLFLAVLIGVLAASKSKMLKFWIKIKFKLMLMFKYNWLVFFSWCYFNARSQATFVNTKLIAR